MKILSLLLGLVFFHADVVVANTAVVNLGKALMESKAGRSIKEQIEELNDKAKNDLAVLESKIKDLESSKKSDDRKIEDMQIALYEMVRAKKYQIAEAYRRAIEKLESKIKEIIHEICTGRNISVVLGREAVVFSGKGCIDLTEDLIRILDQTLPHIDVETVEPK
jgi:Skp family chaperone for outer membrane proteins